MDGRKIILYPVGWNEKDDDCKIVMTRGANGPYIDESQSDWVWALYFSD